MLKGCGVRCCCCFDCFGLDGAHASASGVLELVWAGWRFPAVLVVQILTCLPLCFLPLCTPKNEQDKYQHRLRELEQRDQQQQQQEQEQQHQQQQQPQQQQVSPAAAGANPPTSSDDSGWFSKLLDTFSISSSSSTQQATEKQLTPQQKARRAAAARQAQAKQELGGPPVPPAAPQGLYIYGSVGSGKSLIADMFYDTARQELQLDHSRR